MSLLNNLGITKFFEYVCYGNTLSDYRAWIEHNFRENIIGLEWKSWDIYAHMFDILFYPCMKIRGQDVTNSTVVD